MLVATAFLGEVTTIVGLVAGLIAVGGFLGHVQPALAGANEKEIRQATVRGGLGGVALALAVVVLSALIDRLAA